VTGARQVEKTTMLKHPATEQSRTYVSMDNKANPARGSRGIVCMREEVMPIDAQNCFIPCHLI